jgi:phosphoglycerate dehydrogenase-like enzyme
VIELKCQRSPPPPQAHCLFAGVDHVLSPVMVESPVPLTNAKGLFSSSLAEYSILVSHGCSVRRRMRIFRGWRWYWR